MGGIAGETLNVEKSLCPHAQEIICPGIKVFSESSMSCSI